MHDTFEAGPVGILYILMFMCLHIKPDFFFQVDKYNLWELNFTVAAEQRTHRPTRDEVVLSRSQ